MIEQAEEPRATADDAAWLREHRVAYELESVTEWWEDHGRRPGLELVLFAAAPDGSAPGSDAADRIWLRLRELALGLVPDAVPHQHRSPRPYRSAFVYRPETHLHAEIPAGVRLFPGEHEEADLSVWRKKLEETLHASGIPARVWHDSE